MCCVYQFINMFVKELYEEFTRYDEIYENEEIVPLKKITPPSSPPPSPDIEFDFEFINADELQDPA